MAGELGADVLIDTAAESFPEAVAAATDGDGADLVIEAAGPDECRAACVEAVRRQGRIGVFGLPNTQALCRSPSPPHSSKASR